jgi:heterodisulfide reductase subunit A
MRLLRSHFVSSKRASPDRPRAGDDLSKEGRSVVVVGGGIAGIQVSLDLANMGFKVHLIESTPSIGGRMAQLDKTFPTNDCSMCILSPKMIECANHANIVMHTYSELDSVKGEFPSFEVVVLEKARYVDVSKCTGCGDCIAKCPSKVPSEFDVGLVKRKAIYIPFVQAVPKKMTIDKEHCIFMTKGKCGNCKKVCKAGAIDYEQKDKRVKVRASAIVLATGYDLFDVRYASEFGYGTAVNVVTSLEFERMLNASGPTGGHVARPSDHKEPNTIAFIQCVCSRDRKYKEYCSSVCCMYATKEAILAREHCAGLKSTIFYMDLRAVGKGFQNFVLRAKRDYGVEYVRARPANISEDLATKDPLVYYEDCAGGQSLVGRFDLVVLCPALVPKVGSEGLCSSLGVALDSDGFISIPACAEHPVDTSTKGVFACGFCQTPMDIPDSVVQASGAAARVAQVLEGD